MVEPLATQLAARTTGRVWSRDPADRAGYDEARLGYNRTLVHRPALAVAAATEADVAEAVRFAVEQDLPVDLQATGHGPFRAMDGGLLITTRALTTVNVDAERRVARISAGATSADVLAAGAPHGLAATVGAAPGVGFVSYALGGGLGPIGRAHGYAADHVRRLDVITADGRALTVTPEQEPDLFWALRGGGGGICAVTALEIDLLPIAELYGGALFFAADQVAGAVDSFREGIRTAPPELSLSLAFVTFPDLPVVPAALRGRFCAHLRVAYAGGAGEGDRLIAPMRARSPFLDTVEMLPITSIGTIHQDPVQPFHVITDSLALRSEGALDDLLPLVRQDAPYVLEVRHLGGALAARPARPSSTGHRAARLNLFAGAYPGVDAVAAAEDEHRVVAAFAGAGAGGPIRNFLPPQYPDASGCYEPGIALRLAEVQRTCDPTRRFRFTPEFTSSPASS